jgi:hypothetical protein
VGSVSAARSGAFFALELVEATANAGDASGFWIGARQGRAVHCRADARRGGTNAGSEVHLIGMNFQTLYGACESFSFSIDDVSFY